MDKIKDFILINVGLIFVALGIYLFKIPNKFATGGVSGISIILDKLFPDISVGILMLIINIILLIVGLIAIGPNFGSKTIYSSFALSGMVWLLGRIHPITAPFTNDTLLELIYSILLPAVGSAIVFNQNASTGGTDIVAKILSKLTGLHIGKTLLLADFIITVLAGVVFGIRVGMYSVLGLIIKGFLVDLIIEGFNISKQVVIISHKPNDIINYIILKLNRDATIYKAVGAYSNEEKQVITTILSRRETVKLRHFIRNLDDKAFITITNTSEIIGKGFRNVDM